MRFNRLLLAPLAALTLVGTALGVSASQPPAPGGTPPWVAQLYLDADGGTLNLMLSNSRGQQVVPVGTQLTEGDDFALAEAPNGDYVALWAKARCAACAPYVKELWMTQITHEGALRLAPTHVTNPGYPSYALYDVSPSLAIAPNGQIGVVWVRRLWNDQNQVNENVFFGIVNPQGGWSFAGQNVTGNTAWGNSNDVGVPSFLNASISATADGRFTLAWTRQLSTGPSTATDVFLSVRDGAGNTVLTPVVYPAGGLGDASDAHLTTASANRTLLLYRRRGNSQDLFGVMLDSSGKALGDPQNLSRDGWNTLDQGWPAATPLADGSVGVVWVGSFGSVPVLRYARLSDSGALLAGPVFLPTSGVGGDAYPSIAADAGGHAVITWTDQQRGERRNIYALTVDGQGNPLSTAGQLAGPQGSFVEVARGGQSSALYTPFMDTAISDPMTADIQRLAAWGVSTGCATNPARFCPYNTVNRAEMAAFLERAMHAPAGFTPPGAQGLFQDVPASDWDAGWVEALYADSVTTGCGTNPLRFCPFQPTTRGQTAAFLLRAEYGSNYQPPAATGIFTDVAASRWDAPWIEQLYREQITNGCGVNPLRFCADDGITRAQMAVFIARTFHLP